MEKFQKIIQKIIQKNNSKKIKIFREFFFPIFFWQFIFRSQFGVCLQTFGWSRPTGLGVKGIRTNSSKSLLNKLLYRLFKKNHKKNLNYSKKSSKLF
jgi:hypothetical protein